MAPDAVRTALRQILAEMPYGGKRPLAKALGFRGRWALHSLRSIARGRGYLFEGMRRRLSRGVQQLQRGDLILVPTGQHGAGKRLFTVAAPDPKEGMATVQAPQPGQTDRGIGAAERPQGSMLLPHRALPEKFGI